MIKQRALLAHSGSTLTTPPHRVYRFLISSKAKWSTPTEKVLMTLRLAPVVQKTHTCEGHPGNPYLLFLR